MLQNFQNRAPFCSCNELVPMLQNFQNRAPFCSLQFALHIFETQLVKFPVSLWIPSDSFPMKLGWKRTSGVLNRSLPMVMTLPSGSSYCFSISLADAPSAFANSLA